MEYGDDIVTNTVSKIREQAKKTYNICSLTSEKDDPLMWTYYAGGHSGFCAGYDIKGLGITNYLTQLTLPVLYSDKCSFVVDDIDAIDGSVCMYATIAISLSRSSCIRRSLTSIRICLCSMS